MKSSAGFSLLEMLIVVAILVIGFAFTTIYWPTIKANEDVSSAAATLEQQLRDAREYAVANRRVVHLTLAAPGTITTIYRDWDSVSSSYVWKALGTAALPADVSFDAETGLPNPGPDGNGIGTVAIDFNGAGDIYFWPDGSAQDGNSVALSGVAYIAIPGKLTSSKAVTLFGPTGSIRLYRLSGGPSWVRQ